jgi:hypothetical protein
MNSSSKLICRLHFTKQSICWTSLGRSIQFQIAASGLRSVFIRQKWTTLYLIGFSLSLIVWDAYSGEAVSSGCGHSWYAHFNFFTTINREDYQTLVKLKSWVKCLLKHLLNRNTGRTWVNNPLIIPIKTKNSILWQSFMPNVERCFRKFVQNFVISTLHKCSVS